MIVHLLHQSSLVCAKRFCHHSIRTRRSLSLFLRAWRKSLFRKVHQDLLLVLLPRQLSSSIIQVRIGVEMSFQNVPLFVILVHIVLLMVPATVAWSPNSGFPEPNMERRSFLSNVGVSTTAAAVGNIVLGQQNAYAKEPMSTDATSFDTYNVIPDASASLNPKLLKVDVSIGWAQCRRHSHNWSRWPVIPVPSLLSDIVFLSSIESWVHTETCGVQIGWVYLVGRASQFRQRPRLSRAIYSNAASRAPETTTAEGSTYGHWPGTSPTSIPASSRRFYQWEDQRGGNEASSGVGQTMDVELWGLSGYLWGGSGSRKCATISPQCWFGRLGKGGEGRIPGITHGTTSKVYQGSRRLW